MKYYVINVYGIAGTSIHKSARAALKKRDRREGEGWIVRDETGACWDLVNGEPLQIVYVRAQKINGSGLVLDAWS